MDLKLAGRRLLFPVFRGGALPLPACAPLLPLFRRLPPWAAMAARWGRGRWALGLRTGLGALESEEEAAARLEQQQQRQWRARAARLSRARRWLEPSGPPERQLTRLAMEQMRSLRREAPEEWPVSRLACSFEVSPDVVARILRSRFSPSPERALAQDSRVQQQAQRSSGGSGLPVPANPRLPPSRAGVAAPLAPGPAQRKRAGGGGAPPLASSPPPTPAEDEQPRRLRAVRKGHEVVDEEGNLLYRIPPRG